MEEDNKELETSLSPEDNTKKDKGVYVGVSEEEDNKVDTEDDGLEDVWREMAMAMETSKVCIHSFDFTFQLEQLSLSSRFPPYSFVTCFSSCYFFCSASLIYIC